MSRCIGDRMREPTLAKAAAALASIRFNDHCQPTLVQGRSGEEKKLCRSLSLLLCGSEIIETASWSDRKHENNNNKNNIYTTF